MFQNGGLGALTCRFVKVDVDALQLKIGVSMIGSRRIDAVFVADDFPELRFNLRVLFSLTRKAVPQCITLAPIWLPHCPA